MYKLSLMSFVSFITSAIITQHPTLCHHDDSPHRQCPLCSQHFYIHRYHRHTCIREGQAHVRWRVAIALRLFVKVESNGGTVASTLHTISPRPPP